MSACQSPRSRSRHIAADTGKALMSYTARRRRCWVAEDGLLRSAAWMICAAEGDGAGEGVGGCLTALMTPLGLLNSWTAADQLRPHPGLRKFINEEIYKQTKVA